MIQTCTTQRKIFSSFWCYFIPYYMTKPNTGVPSKIRTYVSLSEIWAVCCRQWEWCDASTQRKWAVILHMNQKSTCVALCVHLSPPEHLIHVTPPTVRPVSLSNLSSQQQDLQKFRNLDWMEGAWFPNENWLTSIPVRIITPKAQFCLFYLMMKQQE